MAKLSKRRKAIQELIEIGKVYSFQDALTSLKKIPSVKFRESIDISLNLGINAKQSDQVVRGAIVLPNGTGKSVRVAVFTQGANVEAAKAAGADLVGMEDLASQIQAGNIDFDVVIASPDAMGVVGRLGQVLGPRGLMPNPKVGTVTPDVATAVKNAKGGQVRYRADKNGIVHCTIGKIDFETSALKENLEALLDSLRKAKPSTSKGIYMKKLTVSSTMGPGLLVDLTSLSF
jgi:large subunit ribosomal protein L1